MNTSAVERLTLESNLHRALERNEFSLLYQPKIDVTSRSIVGVEALIRWRQPELGLVSPAEFIPLAEETGLIIPIGEWVLRTACAQIRTWRDAGLVPVPIAVNLSAKQFQQQNICDIVTDALREYEVAAALAGARNHRERRDAERGGDQCRASQTESDRGAHRDRRLRHRLFELELPQALSDRFA